MALTKEDLNAIREVIREETQPQFDQMHKRFDGIDKVLDDLIVFSTEDVNEMHENHEQRIKKLELASHAI